MAIEYDHRADHYIALGVASAATLDDIKKAHRALIRELHPDHGGEPALAAKVNAARDVLMNPITRAEYDEARQDWHQRHPLLSIFSEAGDQLHRERQETQTAPSADWFDDGPADVRAASHAWQPHRAETGQRVDPQASATEQPVEAPPEEWHVNIARMFVADSVSQAMLSGSWLKAFAMLGAAYILDRVIENRVGDDPARRDVVTVLTKQLREIQALQDRQDIAGQLDPDRAAAPARASSRRNGVARSSGSAARPSRSKKVAGTKRRKTRGARDRTRTRQLER